MCELSESAGNRTACEKPSGSLLLLVFGDLLETLEHGRPVVLGHLFGLFLTWIVVLAQCQGRLSIVAGQLVDNRVIVLRLVLAAAQRTPVRVLEQPLRLDLEDLSLVLIRLSFPLAPPVDGAALFPVGRHLGAVHVFLDLGW